MGSARQHWDGVAEIARELVRAADDEVGARLESAIGRLAHHAGADRAWLSVQPDAGPPLELCWAADDANTFDVTRGESAEKAGDSASSVCLAIDCGPAVSASLTLESDEDRKWPEPETEPLRQAAAVLAAALQRQRESESLRESAERFRALAEHATELISVLGPDACFLYVSPSFEELLGYAPKQLLGTSAVDLIHPDDLSASGTTFVAALESRGVSPAVHRLRHANGSYRWFDNTGRAFRTASGDLRFLSIGRDITDRVVAEGELEEQLGFEQRIADLSRRLLGCGPWEIGAWIQDGLESAAELVGADHAYLWEIAEHPPSLADEYRWLADGAEIEPASIASTGAGAQFPWSAAKIGRGDVILVDDPATLPGEADAERTDLLRRGAHSLIGIPARSGKSITTYLGLERRGPGRPWTSREVSQLRVFCDLFATAVRRKRDGLALYDSQAQLLQSQKMEAVGQLAGGVAHDFNNLLMVILGNVRSLLDILPSDSEVREDAAEIHTAAERAASLTKQLLHFSRREILEPTSIDLNPAVVKASELLQRLLGENIEIAVDCQPNAGSVRSEPGLVEQILVNLALNARDAMPEGGRLRISTSMEYVGSEGASRLGLAARGRYAVVSVEDTGSGIDPQTLDRVFEPFFTTKDRGKGTGLGLAIVYGIARRSGGAIRVESTRGRGSTFMVYLPASAATEAAPAGPSSTQRARGRETVLLVEDEDSVRRIVRKVLGSSGYRILEARDGEEALVIAARPGQRIDLLLTDVVMPRMGGPALAERLSKRFGGLRVLFMSGYPEPQGFSGELPPSHAYLSKPFTDAELLERVQSVLARGD